MTRFLSALAIAFGLAMMFVSMIQAKELESQERNELSPIRNIRPQADRQRHQSKQPSSDNYRSVDGSGNHASFPLRGAALTPLLRMMPAHYSDGVSSLAGDYLFSPRVISNIVATQEIPTTNQNGTTDFIWQWGQFLDHDIVLTDGVEPAEAAPINVPQDDPFFLPGDTMPFNRSIYDEPSVPRQQLNEVSAWIDASNVYGSSEKRLAALREPDSASLKTSEGDLLPFNVESLPNAGGSGSDLFLAGDLRANEQSGLLAMHTLFVREHNRQVAELARRHQDWSNDELFNKARQLVGALMQVITYREFLPALLGPNAQLKKYRGYDKSADGSIRNEFSTAAFRFGHSALSSHILRLNADGSEFSDGHLSLRESFFNPGILAADGSLESILRGLAAQACESVDLLIIDDVRNFLFGKPPSSGFDLAALNLQRGRDHGLPSYNDARRHLGLSPVDEFDDISDDPSVTDRLARAYRNVEDVELWVGGLAEDHLPGGHLGETFSLIIVQQFEALRDGDRYWYELKLSPGEINRVERTRLSDVIRRNTDIGNELQRDVFNLPVSPLRSPILN